MIGLVTIILNNINRSLPCKKAMYRAFKVLFFIFVVCYEVWLVVATVNRLSEYG
jgi:hypothetical protein